MSSHPCRFRDDFTNYRTSLPSYGIEILTDSGYLEENEGGWSSFEICSHWELEGIVGGYPDLFSPSKV